jgi:hypothetical protein
MSRRLIGLVAFSALASVASPAEVSPASFAFGMPVVTPAAAAAYRVSLPIGVYQGTAREDLADIRVFNARGEVVPYALSRPSARALPPALGIALPLFALRGDSPAAADAVRVTIDSPNAAVKLQTQGAAAAIGAVKQYILDGRPLGDPVAALRLAWPDDAVDFAGRLRVDASDDFISWRTLAEAAPVANLHHGGEQLVENHIELPATRAKYWRLSWIGRSAPFELTSVVAQPADGRLEAERSTLETAGSASGVARGEYQFDLGARLPIERVNLGLPELNTVAAVELLSRMDPQDPWRHVAARQFYRVNTADGELRNGPIDIATDSDRYWLARGVGSKGTGRAEPVRLQVAWTPSEIVFLARGSGPFMLAYGNTAAAPAETDLSSIPTAVTVLRATLGVRRELGGQARLAKPAVELPWKRLLLWAVLALSVCLLAWMAYRLSKEIGGRIPG